MIVKIKNFYTKYYLTDIFTCEPEEVDEKEFFRIVGYNRDVCPMHYEPNNINRRNFFLNDILIGYIERFPI